MKKIAVVLSGCGFKDGTEITEAVSALIALSEAGVQYKVFAPNKDFPVTNPISNQAEGTRNIMVEAARISRGEIRDLGQLKAEEFDAVVFPGGYGAAKNLCSWASEGASCRVLPEAEKVIRAFYRAGRPIAALCIAPALVAKVLGSEGVHLTIGNDKETADEIEKTGAVHVECAVDDFISDREHKIITTPAYMYDSALPFQVFTGIRKAIKELVEMA